MANLSDIITPSGVAPLVSPTFTGVPLGPTATSGTNTTQLATTAFVQAASGGGSAGITLLSQDVITTAVAAVDIDLPSGYTRFRLIVQDLTFASSGSYFFGTISLDGGTTFESANYGYVTDKWFSSSGVSAVSGYPSNGFQICGNDLDTNPSHSAMDIINTADQLSLDATTFSIKPTATAYAQRQWASGVRQNSTKADVIRLRDFSNNITGGTFSLYGYKETP